MSVQFQLIAPWNTPRPTLARPEQRAASAEALDSAVAAFGARRRSKLATESIARIDAAIATVGARRGVVERRSAATETVGVDLAARIIRVVGVPWEQPTEIPFRGAIWTEVFTRGAFQGIKPQDNTIRVNRDHDRSRTVGRIVSLDPADPRGLIAAILIAKTPLGDETLALAQEDCLSASVAFTVPAGGMTLDTRARFRRINRAALDHIGLVENPAYPGTSVLSAVG
jgi:HK97 family phage prohead protease